MRFWGNTRSYKAIVPDMYVMLLKYVVFSLDGSRLIHNIHQFDIMFHIHVYFNFFYICYKIIYNACILPSNHYHLQEKYN